MRKTALLVLALVALAIPGAEAAFLSRLRGRHSAGAGMFPADGSVPGLRRLSRILTYRGETFQEHYGSAGNRYLQYGLLNLLSGEYAYGEGGGRTTIELATMETPVAAAGLFHYFRGAVLGSAGRDVPVGVEGVVDAARGDRNLYFYKANIFVKIVYSGREPVPDLVPVAAVIAGNIPAGREDRPDGFKYIEIDGVDLDTVALTPGHTFNSAFLPPSVWASAPAGGSVASDLFIITRRTAREANRTFRDYASYLRTLAEYFDEFKSGGRRFVRAVDPVQGRVVFAAHKRAVVIAARPDGFERGEELINRVIARIDEVDGGD